MSLRRYELYDPRTGATLWRCWTIRGAVKKVSALKQSGQFFYCRIRWGK